MSIEVRGLNKRFGQTVVCDNLTLDIPAGELVALLGPSGSGKTTLLRIIAGLEVPDTGSVLFHGEDATDADVRERRVGFVFQHYALFGHMTIFENVAFGLRVRPRTLPLSGTSRPAMMRSRVVLPEPEGPSSATSSPAGMSMFRLSQTTVLPKRLFRLRTSMLIPISPRTAASGP